MTIPAKTPVSAELVAAEIAAAVQSGMTEAAATEMVAKVYADKHITDGPCWCNPETIEARYGPDGAVISAEAAGRTDERGPYEAAAAAVAQTQYYSQRPADIAHAAIAAYLAAVPEPEAARAERWVQVRDGFTERWLRWPTDDERIEELTLDAIDIGHVFASDYGEAGRSHAAAAFEALWRVAASPVPGDGPLVDDGEITVHDLGDGTAFLHVATDEHGSTVAHLLSADDRATLAAALAPVPGEPARDGAPDGITPRQAVEHIDQGGTMEAWYVDGGGEWREHLTRKSYADMDDNDWISRSEESVRAAVAAMDPELADAIRRSGTADTLRPQPPANRTIRTEVPLTNALVEALDEAADRLVVSRNWLIVRLLTIGLEDLPDRPERAPAPQEGQG